MPLRFENHVGPARRVRAFSLRRTRGPERSPHWAALDNQLTEGQLDTQLAFARPPCTRRSQSPLSIEETCSLPSGLPSTLVTAAYQPKPPALTTPFVRRLRSASSRLCKAASTIPSVSVRAPCGRPVLLFHPDYPVVRRAAKPAKLERRRHWALGRCGRRWLLKRAPEGPGLRTSNEGVEGATMTLNSGSVGSLPDTGSRKCSGQGKPRPGS
jgi:hypothetical protein